jgi:hypothetical protein
MTSAKSRDLAMRALKFSLPEVTRVSFSFRQS